MLTNLKVEYRKATKEDARVIYDWANEEVAREASFYSEPIKWENHLLWFNKKLKDDNTLILIFQYEQNPVGLVRIEIADETIIGISIDRRFRGKKLAPVLLKKACSEFWKKLDSPVFAYIKKDNVASIKSFEKAGFLFEKNGIVNNAECYVYVLKKTIQ
jgi:RimJ/RimL family protein N-acetyltransferase